jgi:hypothetical protein
MSAPTSNDADRRASLPKPSPTPEGRIWLRDLPLPADLVPIIDEWCRERWFWQRARYRRYLEEELKLQWYFGGHYVSYLITPHGYAVLTLDDMSEGATHRLRNQLPAEERDQLRSDLVQKWDSDDGHILSIIG